MEWVTNYPIFGRIPQWLVRNQREWHCRVVRQLYWINLTVDLQFLRKDLPCGFANRIEKIARVEPRRVWRRIKDTLRCCHGDDSTAGLLQRSSGLGASSPSRTCLNRICNICILFLTRWFNSLNRTRCCVSACLCSLISTSTLIVPIILPAQSRSGFGCEMKGTLVPSGRSATASALRMARPP